MGAENIYQYINLNDFRTRTVHWTVGGALSDTMGGWRLITYKTATGNLLDCCKTIRDLLELVLQKMT